MGTDEQRLIRDDVQTAVFGSVLAGLVTGLAIGLVTGLAGGLATGLAGGLVTGLATGLAAVRFFIAVLIFKITAIFPDRPTAFLAWARNSGLLRVNAGAYQFRHQTYQQWILHHAQPEPAAD
jgi:hypothetical protein